MLFPSLIRRGGLPAVFIGMVLRLAAQDATLAPLDWLEAKDAPDTLPALRNAPKFSFPSELKQTKEIGYAIADTYLDEAGKRLGFYPVANLPVYEEPAYAGIKELKFSPAKRAGQPVNAAIQLAVIYNPKSAAVDGPDTTPRLLAVTVVRVKFSDALKNGVQKWVYADVTVDEGGRVTAVKNVAPEWSEAFFNAAREWRFAPARRAGQPVAAEVHVPFLLTTRGSVLGQVPGKGKTVPPEVTSQTAPTYPEEMRRSGLRGDVVIEFTIDREGRLIDPLVKSSLHPAFEGPALDALRRWKFKPGWRDGIPADTRMVQAFSFRMEEFGGGDTGFSVKADKKTGITPPGPIARMVPVYPYALLRDKVKGKAKVVMVVGENGKVVSSRVVEASRPEFGLALQAATEVFEFSPALKDGRPVPVELTHEQDFSLSYMDEVVTEADQDMVKREGKQPGTILMAKQLGAPLHPIVRRAPRFPTSVDEKITAGEALVEIIIDEEGHVRLPRIVSASQEAFGYAAAQAVAAWRFDPPKALLGRTVAVRVRVPFVFKQTTSVPADTKK
ncbi:MAG: TonB family protein [Verrucomicrobia bacterium]|nr:TonB family protein [Verrucomicrobiota bacterium]